MCINVFDSKVTCVKKVPSSGSMVAELVCAQYRITTLSEKISMSKDVVEKYICKFAAVESFDVNDKGKR